MNCYKNSLILAKEYRIRSIAFPSISTEVFHFPLDMAAKIAVSTVREFLEEQGDCFDLVEWVLFDEKTYGEYQKQIDSI